MPQAGVRPRRPELLTPPSLSAVRRMLRVDRPAVEARRIGEAAMLFGLLGCIVVRLAKGLERTAPKLDRVTVVSLDVVADGCSCYLALQATHAAERFGCELRFAELPPPRQCVPRPPSLRTFRTKITHNLERKKATRRPPVFGHGSRSDLETMPQARLSRLGSSPPVPCDLPISSPRRLATG